MSALFARSQLFVTDLCDSVAIAPTCETGPSINKLSFIILEGNR